MSSGRPFDKLLIANRGEIARRVIRTARRMGIHTIAVCSEVDQKAPFAVEADEQHVIGPAPPKESYLSVERILEVARKCGARAIHPGYGFLSENAGFVRAVQAAGLIFVGPSAEAMERVGGKLAARKLAAEAGVPVVPGSPAIESLVEARRYAAEIGYPVMLKASAGGGGIGMTVVEEEGRLERALEDARKKGQTFFNDATVYLEKRVEKPAHVEVQIFGDARGAVAAIGERDCSVQRRNQKVLEESPSPRVDAALREAMLEAARRLARASGYTNAGTVEMIVGGAGSSRGKFYFLEVNSRLQVEHPVTEEVTGLDLVEAQLWIAAGEALPAKLSGAVSRGHAIEARVCAEDPDKRFMPSPGTISAYHAPEGVRVDSAIEAGSLVPPNYDSLLAKVIASGPDRTSAIAKLTAALASMRIEGIKTNLGLFPKVLSAPAFVAGTHDTGLIAELGYKT